MSLRCGLTAIVVVVSDSIVPMYTPSCTASNSRANAAPRVSTTRDYRRPDRDGQDGQDGSACGHASTRPSTAAAKRQRQFALGVGPQRQCKKDGQDGKTR